MDWSVGAFWWVERVHLSLMPKEKNSLNALIPIFIERVISLQKRNQTFDTNQFYKNE